MAFANTRCRPALLIRKIIQSIIVLTLILFIGPLNVQSVEAEVRVETVSETRTGEKVDASSVGPEATSQETAEARVEAQATHQVQTTEEAEAVVATKEIEDATRVVENTTEGTQAQVVADQEAKEAMIAIGEKVQDMSEIVVEVILQCAIVTTLPVPAELPIRRGMEHTDLAHAHTHLAEVILHAQTAETGEVEAVYHQEH